MNEFLRAVALVCGVHVSLLRDMVQCVSRRLLWCPCDVVFLWLGRCAGSCTRDLTPPALRGSSQQVAAPATYFRPPGRPCRKESQTISLIPFRIPWIATGSGLSVHARASPEPEPSRTTGLRDYKSSWNPSHRGQPALVSTKVP